MVGIISVRPNAKTEVELGKLASDSYWLDIIQIGGATITFWLDDLTFLEKLHFELGVYLRECDLEAKNGDKTALEA